MNSEISLPGLIAWLERQDPAATYDYQNSAECLAAQFLRAHGVEEAKYRTCGPIVGETFFPELYHASCGNYKRASWTFGKALERARRALPSQQDDKGA